MRPTLRVSDGPNPEVPRSLSPLLINNKNKSNAVKQVTTVFEKEQVKNNKSIIWLKCNSLHSSYTIRRMYLLQRRKRRNNQIQEDYQVQDCRFPRFHKDWVNKDLSREKLKVSKHPNSR